MLTIFELLYNARTELKSRINKGEHNSVGICDLVSEISEKYGTIYKDGIHDLYAYEELYSDAPKL